MVEKILIIDDEEDILSFLRDVIESEGYEVISASDGEEGIALFKKEKPDLVITDVKMPRKNGLEVLKDLKTSADDTDIIILTGHSDEATAIECLRQGAYDYLVKPLVDIDIFLAAIYRALTKKKLEEQNKQLIKELAQLAIRDPLTGLYNQRELHANLEEEIRRSERYGHSFCAIMMDIDHFKAVNDTYGHIFGDYVLKELGGVVCKTIRSIDRCYRYGGEEFFILLPEESLENGKIVAKRLVDSIRDHSFCYDGNEAKITVSIGMSLYPEQATNEEGLIRSADQSLYEAKQGGRDMAVFFSLPLAES